MSSPRTVPHTRLRAAAVTCAALLAGCDGTAPPPADAAVHVNRQAVTQEQVAYALQRDRRADTTPAADDAAQRQTLERLIDDELALQKAHELRLDRDPRVLRALEAARRDIIVRAYRESTGDSASKPEADAVRRYHDANPALFAQRRIYTLQETVVADATPEQLQALGARVDAKATPAQIAAHLQAQKLRFASSQAVRAAEQLPLQSLPQLAALRDGQSLLLPAASGARLVTVLSSQPAPIDEAQARPLIEQFLWNENKRRVVEADRKALREAATIEYAGRMTEANGVGGAARTASTN